ESGKSSALTQCSDAVAPAGQDLVWIGLMADIPDQAIARRIKDVMQRHRQLDYAETSTEMAAGRRDSADRFVAELVGNLPQAVALNGTQIIGSFNLIKQWCSR